uniref:asparagine synthase (glutamine-hydrolyzing) n=1 Tax=viral metagenome TaxID=1070528 RepID=A0A6C0AYJ7_9ZZZZ|tara:strand:- start:6684 stop:8432 length:1749 start_codon:yes stop_codon:yes gene_type:complete
MCGIFALFNNDEAVLTYDFILEQFNKSQSRGPDNSNFNVSNNNYIGFHRLSINGLDEESNQPFNISNIQLICNGEIYNYKKLFDNITYKPTTNSDCEIIIYLYMLYGIEYTLNLLDGVFAFVLIDYNINKIFVARDPYGVRPLYYLYNPSGVLDYDDNQCAHANLIGFSSEIKQLSGFTEKLNNYELETETTVKVQENNSLIIKPVLSGEYLCLELSYSNKWYLYDKKFYNSFNMPNYIESNENTYLDLIHGTFCNAIKKRVTTTDRPIACLLSGGLDSSIVTAIVKKYYPYKLETYSIGLAGSEDLQYAKIVASYLDTNHTEIIVSEEDFFDFIPDVIKNIESYDTTTVRASVGNYLVSKYISEKSDAKVIFNGDGSDELMGGYLYMQSAPDHFEFDKECKRLINDIHYFDVLRSDRSVSTNGLEPRTPFLDRQFVQTYLSIPSKIRYNTNKKQEKYLFRKAFDRNYLPKKILWRRKEAFSDGVSSLKRSWYQIIEEKVKNQTIIEYDLNVQYNHNPPQTLEQLYYRSIFENYYPNLGYIIPYYWMPKYVNASDSSARTLDIYTSSNNYYNTISNTISNTK